MDVQEKIKKEVFPQRETSPKNETTKLNELFTS